MVSNIFYFHPYLGKIPILTNIFQRGWNHQLLLHLLCYSSFREGIEPAATIKHFCQAKWRWNSQWKHPHFRSLCPLWSGRKLSKNRSFSRIMTSCDWGTPTIVAYSCISCWLQDFGCGLLIPRGHGTFEGVLWCTNKNRWQLRQGDGKKLRTTPFFLGSRKTMAWHAHGCGPRSGCAVSLTCLEVYHPWIPNL